MNFLTRLATATGQSMLAGQQFEQAQADLEYKQQATAMQKMQVMAARQKAETDKLVGAQLQADFSKDRATLADPAKAAEVYAKAARTSLSRNDFDGARSFESLAQAEVQRAQTAAANLREQQKARAEGLANAAANFRSNPTPDAAATVVQSALAAGVPVKDIPDMRDPRFGSWVKQQETAGMTSKERVQEQDRVRKHEEELAYRTKRDEEARQDRLQRQRETAAFRQEGLELRKVLVASTLAQRETKAGVAGAGDLAGVGKVEMTHRGQAIAAGAQAVRQIEQLALGFQPGATLGPFAALKPGTDIATSLKMLGGTALTPASAQAMQAVTANLAKNIGNLLTAVEGSRAPTDSQVKVMQTALAPSAGENVLVSAFKIKNAIEEIEAGLHGAKHADPEKEAQRQRTLQTLKGVMPGVSSLEILKTLRDSGNQQALGQIVKAQSDYNGAVRVLGLGEQKIPEAPPQKPTAKADTKKPLSVDEWLSQ